jgi:hypothetical protein
MAATPTKRTLDALRKAGWTVAVVERWNSHAKIRQDLFGFIDVLAIKDGVTLAVQACAGSGHSKRRDKILAEPRAALWLRGTGRQLDIWSWSQRGERGKRKVWTPRIEPITLENFNPAPTYPLC